MVCIAGASAPVLEMMWMYRDCLERDETGHVALTAYNWERWNSDGLEDDTIHELRDGD